MIGIIIASLLLLLLLASVANVIWAAANQRWEARAERARVDTEVRRAERQLHGLASRAFASMLDVAREHTHDQDK